MFEQDKAGGMDQMGQGDFAMPFLRVLGQLSPEINKRDSKYVEGAEAGMIFNTVTKQTYDGEKGVNVLPCGYKREYVEWSDRGEGTSAPVAIHPVSSGIIKDTTRGSDYKDRLPNGNYLENTASYFVMMEDMSQALITMKSTQLKVSRSWNSMMNSIKLKGANGLFTPASTVTCTILAQFNNQMTRELGLVGMCKRSVLYRIRACMRLQNSLPVVLVTLR